MNPLDLNTLPLQGTRLIEASAGTGKTFTIANVYLRVLLELGHSVEQILVVTFTNDATDELRGRIRQRLVDARLALEEEDAETLAGRDPVLSQLLHPYWGDAIAKARLKNAIVCMDEAAIFTIHGFCQRVLKKQAFESGRLFEQTLGVDDLSLATAAAQSLWRKHFVQAEEAHSLWLEQHWPTLEALSSFVRKFPQQCSDIHIAPAIHDEAQLTDLYTQCAEQYSTLKALWQLDASGLFEDLAAAIPDYKKNAKYWKDGEAYLNLLGNSFQAYFSAAEWHNPPPLLSDFHSEALSKALKKAAAHQPSHAFIGQWSAFLSIAQQYDVFKLAYWGQRLAAEWRTLLEAQKQRLRVLSFDDLLSQLQNALAVDTQGDLHRALRQQYPAAMIDEFQDTDSVQYDIFQRLYAEQSHLLWLMIGDPKQAIYAFRGADIFTYLHARAQVPEENHYTLVKNWRSDHALVDAVNRVFSTAQNGFLYRDIPFHPVESDPKTLPTALQRDQQGALHFNVYPQSDEKISTDALSLQLCQQMAQQIQALLAPPSDLHEGDIAVLVSAHKDGALAKEVLAEHGIRAVSRAKDGVLDTLEADDLLRLLNVLTHAASPGRVKALLATPLFGLAPADLLHLEQDEQRLSVHYGDLQADRERLRRQGFLAMFFALAARQHLSQRLTGSMGGERSLTNYLHIAELLQAEQQRCGDLGALLLWFEQQCHSDETPEDKQLRLESDSQLVQIFTVHASKGLEYPVVFLPFSWKGDKANTTKPPLAYHDEHYRAHLDFGSERWEDAKSQQQRAAQAESIRKLYVALTRAKYRCYVSLGPNAALKRNALYQLLCGHLSAKNSTVAYEQLIQTLEEIASDCSGLTLSEWTISEDDTLPLTATAEAPEKAYTARPWTRELPTPWTVTSFSALLDEHSLSSSHHATDDSADPIDNDDTLSERESPETLGEPDYGDIAQFPKGSHAGTLMHTLFEEIEDLADDQDLSNLEHITQLLTEAGFDSAWCAALLNMLKQVSRQPLMDGLSLAALAPHQKVVEMGFHYPYDAAHLQRLANSYEIDPDDLAVALEDGLLKGFIDLTLEWQGKFYVLDYKSNYLGAHPSSYHHEALAQAMASHHYALQYSIYAMAVCRYLQQRLPDFDYDQHFGGVLYLFVRGMGQENPDYGIYRVPPDEPKLRELVLNDLAERGGQTQ